MGKMIDHRYTIIEKMGEEASDEKSPSEPEIVTQEPTGDQIVLHRAKLPRWLLSVGIALIILGLMFGIGSSLVNLGTRGSGPLPALATATPTATFTPTPTPTPTLGIGSTMIREKDGMEMVYVPVGDFTMGSEDGFDDEKPIHEVYLDAYWIDKYNVSNDQFTAFVEATNHETEAERHGESIVFTGTNWEWVEGANWHRPQGPDSSLSGLGNHPVVHVRWFDADAYCRWAGGRLPTEAEWEKAARGTDWRTYPWGNQPVNGSLANFADKNLPVDWANKSVDDGYTFTAPVGSYPAGASQYGAMDMAGNVWEWVEDWFAQDYYSKNPLQNPTGPTSGSVHVLRGGSWLNAEYGLRSANRGWGYPSIGGYDLGFRCVSPP